MKDRTKEEKVFTVVSAFTILFAVCILLLTGSFAAARELRLKKNIEGYSLEAAFSQNPPIVGRNDVMVVVTDPSGKSVANASVTVNYFMPPMPGMPPMNYTAKATFRNGGYGTSMDLIMRGPWNIAIKAGVGQKQLRMNVLIDVR